MWQDRIKFGWSGMPKNPGYKMTLQMWLKFKIQGGSASASINENGRSIFLRTLLSSIFLTLVDCSIVLLPYPMEEGERGDEDDGDGRRFASAFVSLLQSSWWLCLISLVFVTRSRYQGDRLCSSFDFICSNMSSFDGGYGLSEVLLGRQWWWILIPSLLHMPCSLRSMLNLVALTLGLFS